MTTRTVAYEDRSGHFIFVRVPGEYGRYVRTSWYVALAPCPACKSEAGVPCVGQYRRYTGSVHVDRCVKAKDLLREAGINVESANKNQEEHPVLKDDVLSDDQPGVIGAEDRNTVDLREFFK